MKLRGHARNANLSCQGLYVSLPNHKSRLIALNYLHRDIDAKQTYRIRELKGSPQNAFYGRKSAVLHKFWCRLMLSFRCGGNVNYLRIF